MVDVGVFSLYSITRSSFGELQSNVGDEPKSAHWDGVQLDDFVELVLDHFEPWLPQASRPVGVTADEATPLLRQFAQFCQFLCFCGCTFSNPLSVICLRY